MAAIQNAADASQVKERDRRSKSAREQELDDMAWLLSTPTGRRIVWRYLGLCGVFKTSFTGNSTTFFNEGARNVGLTMMGDVNESAPEAYVQMLAEAQAREKMQA